jgi:hypothetical protein
VLVVRAVYRIAGRGERMSSPFKKITKLFQSRKSEQSTSHDLPQSHSSDVVTQEIKIDPITKPLPLPPPQKRSCELNMVEKLSIGKKFNLSMDEISTLTTASLRADLISLEVTSSLPSLLASPHLWIDSIVRHFSSRIIFEDRDSL